MMPSWVRDRFYFFLVGGYLIAVLLSYIYYGVVFQFTLGIISLVLLPVTVVLGHARQYLKEFTPFLVLLLSYEALQGVAGSIAASHSLFSLYNIDFSLWGTNLTGDIQTMFYSATLTDVTTFLYSLHFPMVAVAAILLWYSSKAYYKKYVYALLFSSYFSLLIFLVMPTAPPWYAGAATNLVQHPQSSSIMTGFFASVNTLTSSIESDKFAAFPSLHTAYALLFAYYITRARKVYGLIVIPISAGVLFSTLYLGQHYLIDLIGGGLVSAAAILISIKISKMPLNKPEPAVMYTSSQGRTYFSRLVETLQSFIQGN